jgi:CRISPR-associated endonuclease/helicase Cas3
LPPDYALLRQHSRDAEEACDALAQAVGGIALNNAAPSDEVEFFRVTLRMNGWFQDLGKANSHFQEMVAGRAERYHAR